MWIQRHRSPTVERWAASADAEDARSQGLLAFFGALLVVWSRAAGVHAVRTGSVEWDGRVGGTPGHVIGAVIALIGRGAAAGLILVFGPFWADAFLAIVAAGLALYALRCWERHAVLTARVKMLDRTYRAEVGAGALGPGLMASDDDARQAEIARREAVSEVARGTGLGPWIGRVLLLAAALGFGWTCGT